MADQRATGASDGDGLTDQERRVALAVGRGATNKATARELGISIKTVEFHLSNVYRKLDLDGRTQLANLVGSHSIPALDRDGSVDRFQTVDELAAALADGSATAGPSDPVAVRNPYKGLRAFQEADCGDYFGRQQLIDKLVHVLAGTDTTASRFVMVVGPSGSGKSSLVLAGLVPALRGGAVPGSEDWLIASMLPGAHPLDELEGLLDRVGAEPAGDVLLVLDQFEELYTLCTDEERSDFIDALVEAAVGPHPRLRVVATLRADFYDRPLRDPQLAPLLDAGQVPVPPMTIDQLEQAIVEPAQRCGARLEPGLVATLVADVRDQPGALPLLQYALTEVFERNDDGLLTLGAYQAIGGLAGAVSTRAEDLYGVGDEDERAATRRMLTRLVALGEGTEDTRRRVRARELGDGPAIRAVVARLGEARLLSFDRDPASGEPTVELAHEALIREWPRLRAWMDEDRDGLRLHRDLTARASAWQEAGGETGELYRGGRLESAEHWAADHGDDLNDTERCFLVASVAQRQAELDAERRNMRRIKRGLVLVAVVAVIALVAGAIAWRQQQRATTAARAADRERDAAQAAEFASETARLAALAPTLTKSDPALALLLAAEAERRKADPETWGALEQTLVAADTTLGFLFSDEPLRGVSFDGPDRIVGVGSTSVTVWDAQSHQRLTTMDLPMPMRRPLIDDDNQQPLAIAAGTLAWVGEDGQAHVLDLAGGEHGLADLAEVDTVAVDSTGERVAVVNRAGDVALYRWPGLEPLWRVPGAGPYSVKSLAESLGFGRQPAELDAYPVLPELLFGADNATLVVARGWSVTTHDAATGTKQAEATFPMYVAELALEAAAPQRVLALGLHALAAADLPLLENRTAAGLDSRLPIYEIALTGLPDGRLAVVTTQGQVTIVASGELSTPAPAPAMVLAPPTTSVVSETLDAHVTAARASALSPDGTTLVVAGDPGASLVAVDGGGLLRRAVPRATGHHYFIGGREAGWIGSSAPVVGQARTTAHVWTCERPRCQERLELGLDPTMEITSEPERDLLVIYTTRSPTSASYQFFDGPTSEPRSPAIFPDSHLGGWNAVARDESWVVITNLGTSLQVFELATGRPLTRAPLEEGWELPGVAPLPQGDDVIVSNPSTGASYVLDVRTGQRKPSPLPQGEAAIAIFSRSGRVLATADPRGQVALRDGATFEVLHQLTTAESISPFMSMAFSDDDRFLLTVHPTGGRLWDVGSGRLIGQLIPTLATTAPTALPGERPHLLTASERWVQIWDLDVDSWGGLACLAAGRNLTRDEWDQVGPRDEGYHATCPQWPASE